MAKRFVSLLSGAALLVGLVVPAATAGAQSAPPPDSASAAGAAGAAKVLGKSATGSYVVVLAADPLAKSIAPRQLDGPAARARASTMKASHATVLRDAGLSSSVKIHDYTNALNGFSALVGYDAAVAIAADPRVALVVPDELRHAQTN